ncbi:hypothetical protein LTS17_012428 [Exophiala oligosperma]
MTRPKVAVLYQACDPPVVNGVRKPKKPGGYQDSGADIAYVLRSRGVDVLTPLPDPNPRRDEGWCFPDTEAGIVAAVKGGATTLWANTILFASHPLQTSSALDVYAPQVKVIGQPPLLVEQYDDKNHVNSLLRDSGAFTLPRSWIVHSPITSTSVNNSLENLPYPVVAKPIRGRGSHGVKLCRDRASLEDHLSSVLFKESPSAMVEEFLSGPEATVTVMPPLLSSTSASTSPPRSSSRDLSDHQQSTQTRTKPTYTALPIVLRFNHEDGIAPYSGVVAVTANSRALPKDELDSNPRYAEISRQCERIADLLRVTAPIRVDVRCFDDRDPNSKFAVFDVNMKPNMTGPGRPGREDQSSLTAIAAVALGWDYPRLLLRMLDSTTTLEQLRRISIK